MARMRTIVEAAAYFKDNDPDTAITKTAIRRLVITGAVPSVMVGNKYLIALEGLEDYLTTGAGHVQAPEHYGVRRIEVHP